jgi:hypothetical protein
MTTTTEFAEELGLVFHAKETGRRTDGMMADMPVGSRHFLLAIENPATGQGMTVQWSQGPAIESDPELPDVLDTLASDATGFENVNGLSEWAREYGYSDDVERAVSTFEAVKGQAERLRVLLGDDDYERLLWNVERD